MANTKITELTALTQCAATDVLPIVKVSANTTKKVSISDLLRNAPAGTAGAPSIANADDQDTGILFPAADSIGVSTGGTQRLVIDSSGNVGIGQSSPVVALQVSGASAARIQLSTDNTGHTATDGVRIQVDSSNNLELLQRESANIEFFTAGTERLRIDSSGNVGIGTTSPSSKLNLSGGAENVLLETTNSSGDAFFGIRNGSYGLLGTGDAYIYRSGGDIALLADGASDVIKFATGGNSERLRIDSSGNVGIGTSSPGQLLHIEGSNAGANIRVQSRAFFGGQYSNHFAVIGSAVRVDTGQTTGMVSTETSSGNGRPSAIRFGAGAIEFHSAASSTAGAAFDSERMRIDSSGNVGIGTTSPSQKLHIYEATGGDVGIRIQNNDGYAELEVDTDELNYNADSHVFNNQADSAERMRIDSSGNVGIGLTSPGAPLAVASSGGINAKLVGRDNGTVDEAQLYFMHNDNSTVHGIIEGKSTSLNLYGGTTLAQTIDSSGNVGIGTSSPGSNLDIEEDGVSANAELAINYAGSGSGRTSAIRFQRGGSNFAYIAGATFALTSGNNDDLAIAPVSNKNLLFGIGNSEKARIDSSGRLLVGTSTSPSSGGAQYAKLFVAGNTLSATGNGRFGLASGSAVGSLSDGNGIAEFLFTDVNGAPFAAIGVNVDGTPGTNDYPGRLVFSTTADSGNSPTERMRIDSSGRVMIGSSSPTVNSTFAVQKSGSDVVGFVNTSDTAGQTIATLKGGPAASDSTTKFFSFQRGDGVERGTIKASGTGSVSYNTSSDYRLKENVVDISDSIIRFKELQPRRFNFIEDPDTTVDGFIAHEAQTVVPEAVTGTHNEVDDDNNPVYQGIDQSKLVPLLTAALQEAIAKIETLETKVAALEAQ